MGRESDEYQTTLPSFFAASIVASAQAAEPTANKNAPHSTANFLTCSIGVSSSHYPWRGTPKAAPRIFLAPFRRLEVESAGPAKSSEERIRVGHTPHCRCPEY